jgi:membrane-associated phospholipid phosphatase
MAGNGQSRNGRQRGIARRVLLKLGLGAAGTIMPTMLAAQGIRRSRRDTESPPLPAQPYPAPVLRPPRIDPILFWNDTALQLDALDHSLDAKDARAPGPCAASRALALAHIVMADATAVAYPTEYQGYYVRGDARFGEQTYADVFIGAAAARILGHIYSTPAHTHLIGSQRQRFLKAFDSGALAVWNAGLEFGRNEKFTSSWHWASIKEAALASLRRGHALARGEHDVDPFNPDQKFYGVNWGSVSPLVRDLPIAALAPPAPPPEGHPDYIRDLEEVAAIGAYRPEGPTEKQVKVGLFWAYDGARLIGTPPRLYNQLIVQIAESDGLTTPELARLLALCNLAMADAAIICWEAKYHYRLWRPVIGIPEAHGHPVSGWRPFGSPRTNPPQFVLGPDARRLTALSMLGGGERNAFGEPAKNRLPYNSACFTPNFPSYPSGHATFGAAGFGMLKRMRSERGPTQRDPGRIDQAGPFVSDELNGISIDNFANRPRPYLPLHYSSIDQMIEDNNKSRVHLGVHWDFDCEIGARLGATVTDAVYRLAYRAQRP